MSIINHLEQMLCPHDHHRDPDGVVRCCMCGHTTQPRRTVRRGSLAIAAAAWLLAITALAALIVEVA